MTKRSENEPRPFDLSNVNEIARLFREIDGYLGACAKEHHGTDFDGRLYARAALRELSHIRLRAAIADEREACAKVAEADTSFDMLQDFGMQSHSAQLRINIAEAIRNRASAQK